MLCLFLGFYIYHWLFLFNQDESPGTPKKKKEVKKKFKLEPHEDQLFLDGNEVRVCAHVQSAPIRKVFVFLIDLKCR